MQKLIDLPRALWDAVELVGQIELYRNFFQSKGEGKAVFGDGQTSHMSAAVIEGRFHQLQNGGLDSERWTLFRECQRAINPIQSNLQGRAQTDPALVELLSRIIAKKTEWAALERYPHAVLHRSAHETGAMA